MHTAAAELQYLWPRNCQTLPEAQSPLMNKIPSSDGIQDKDSGCGELFGTEG